MEPIYKRVLIKLSGEAVYGSDIAEYETLENGDKKVKHVPVIDKAKLLTIAEAIKKCHDLGVEIGIVFGGGNIWRGGQLGEDHALLGAEYHAQKLACAVLNDPAQRQRRLMRALGTIGEHFHIGFCLHAFCKAQRAPGIVKKQPFFAVCTCVNAAKCRTAFFLQLAGEQQPVWIVHNITSLSLS